VSSQVFAIYHNSLLFIVSFRINQVNLACATHNRLSDIIASYTICLSSYPLSGSMLYALDSHLHSLLKLGSSWGHP